MKVEVNGFLLKLEVVVGFLGLLEVEEWRGGVEEEMAGPRDGRW